MASNQYNYQRASEIATRSLVSDNKPSEKPSSSSSDVEPHQKPTLQRKPTNNYEQAAAAAASTGQPATEDPTDRPGVQRQQSWRMRDFKGQQQTQMLSGLTSGQGYSTTQKPS